MQIKKVIFPAAKDRPKTKYLKMGFEKIGVPVEISKALLQRHNPPSNNLGPYIYPIQFVFDKKTKLIFYDINTTGALFRRFLTKGKYFKIHIKPNDLKRGVIPVPNTPSSLEFIKNLKSYRYQKDLKEYDWDFFFSGWASGNGMRIKACKSALVILGRRAYCGMQDFKHHRKAPGEIKRSRIEPHIHWMMQATSKLNLALPGGSAAPWVSFRHVELWGIGSAVFTCAPNYHVFGNPENCWIEFKPNFSDFKEKVNQFIKHDDLREEIAENGRDYFDRYYTPEKQAEYFIRKAENA